MRIALTCNFSPWSRYRGGGQRSTHFLASALSRRGHRVSVVFTKPPWEPVEVPPDLPYEVRWAPLLALRSTRNAPLRMLSALTVARALQRLMLEGRLEGSELEVVHGQGEECALVPSRVAAPLILTPRYPSYPAPPEGSAGRALAWLWHGKYRLLHRAARGAQLVCPTSESSARQVGVYCGLGSHRIHVVPNGIDPTFFEGKRQAGAHAGPLLYFGRLEREKGIDTLLEAYEQLPHGRPLLIAGEGTQRAWLRRQVEQRRLQGRVQLLGWQSARQLARLLSEASVAVLPSREESFGNAMLEAMAAGAPLVTTVVGSLPSIVSEGETGHLVAPGDAKALSHSVSELLRSRERAEAMGARARRHVAHRYSWLNVAERYERLYERASRGGAQLTGGSGASG